MHHILICPQKTEALKQWLKDHDWELILQDAGQNHFVGWGYIMQWQHEEALIWLHYSDKQGVAEARIEFNSAAKAILPLNTFKK